MLRKGLGVHVVTFPVRKLMQRKKVLGVKHRPTCCLSVRGKQKSWVLVCVVSCTLPTLRKFSLFSHYCESPRYLQPPGKRSFLGLILRSFMSKCGVYWSFGFSQNIHELFALKLIIRSTVINIQCFPFQGMVALKNSSTLRQQSCPSTGPVCLSRWMMPLFWHPQKLRRTGEPTPISQLFL